MLEKANIETFTKEPWKSTGCNHATAKPAMKCFCLDVGSIDLLLGSVLNTCRSETTQSWSLIHQNNP